MTADPATLRAAKDRIACSILGGDHRVEPRLGAVRLRPHQQTAVNRLLEIITRYRGALLADAVGLGKTYVALAIAREHARPLVICPAALRGMWERAMATAGTPIPVVSVEGLARGERPEFDPDLLLVDEAHHFRTPATRRYDALAGLARRARVLLMSATPLHNSRRDLTALLGLFAGSGIAAWPDVAIRRLIVRRDEHAANQFLPPIHGPHPLSPGADDDCLDAILALPPGIPAADEGVARALTTISLVHLWASSRAALLASIRKRRARALALRDAIRSGHLPTSSELSAWQYADDTLQLAFPFCVTSQEAVDVPELQSHLDAFVHHAGQLIEQCRTTPDPDAARVHLLRTLRVQHTGHRVVAFSQYAHTVTALGRLMRADHRVAVITADGGTIASGSVTRTEILTQFAGEPQPVPAAARIDLLLTTDLLSEGIDLRGASVIVHLDLPWNPARLEQRVGRARRIGSPHEAIHVYTFVPPTAAERILELQRRLAAKVRTAACMIGGMNSPIDFSSAYDGSARPTPHETLRARIAGWIDPAARTDGTATVIAAATSHREGWIGAVHVDGLARLIYSMDGTIGDDPDICAELSSQLGVPAEFDPVRGDEAVAQIQRWLASRSALAGIDGQSAPKSAVLDRLAQTIARSP
ncbi:MAG: helicase-related protein, partial [Gemmatimonadaceae bacterium]